MSVKYHINQETGRPNQCHASVRECPVGGDHYGSPEEAYSAYESQHLDKIFSKMKKRQKSGFISKLDSGITKMEEGLANAVSVNKLRSLWRNYRAEVVAGAVGVALVGGLAAVGVAYANHPNTEYQGTATSNSRAYRENYKCGHTKVGNVQTPITCYRTRYKAKVEWNGHNESFSFKHDVREGDTIIVKDGFFGTSARLAE